jgi:hypothetical protein
MTNADNDNEPFTFQTLAAITARVLATEEKQDEKSRQDSAGSHDRKTDLAYVEHRLREIEQFERRALGETRRDKKPR